MQSYSRASPIHLVPPILGRPLGTSDAVHPRAGTAAMVGAASVVGSHYYFCLDAIPEKICSRGRLCHALGPMICLICVYLPAWRRGAESGRYLSAARLVRCSDHTCTAARVLRRGPTYLRCSWLHNGWRGSEDRPARQIRTLRTSVIQT